MNQDEHLFIKLMEECAEVQHRVSKLLQFGAYETASGMLFNNSRMLRVKLDDLIAVITLLEEELLIPVVSPESAERFLKQKREKIAKYLAYSKELGTVVDI